MFLVKWKRKRSDSVLWQKPLHQQKCQKGKMTQLTQTKRDITLADSRRKIGCSLGLQARFVIIFPENIFLFFISFIFMQIKSSLMPFLAHQQIIFMFLVKRKRKRSDSVLWQNPYTNKNVKRAKWHKWHKQRHKKFDYRAVADRLRPVSWSTFVTMATKLVWFTWFTGPTFPLSVTTVLLKWHTFKSL